MQELVNLFPHAPKIARPGQINAWDNDDFVKAIEETGKTTYHRRRSYGRLCCFPGTFRYKSRI